MLGRMLEIVPIRNEDIIKPGGLRKYPFHYAQAVSGVTVMMVMLGLMVCSTTLIHERDSGTLSRLMSWLCLAAASSGENMRFRSSLG